MPETQPSAVQPTSASVVVPPTEPPKKGPGVLWLVIALALVFVGAGGYFLYAQSQKPAEQTTVAPLNQEDGPDQGFGAQPTVTPATTPAITTSDSFSDIEKDLSDTMIESENTSEFDADLQSL